MEALLYFIAGIVVAAICAIIILVIQKKNSKKTLADALAQAETDKQNALLQAETDKKNALALAKKDEENALATAKNESDATIARLETDIKNLKANLEQTKKDSEAQTQQLLSAKELAHKEAIAAIEKRHQEVIEAEKKRFDETMAKVSAQMKNTTEEMLRQRQAELQQTNTTSMQQIVNPLKETLQKMETALKENKSTQETSTEAIKENIATLVNTTMRVSDSAERLSNALTAESKTQGNWGEMKIETLLNAIGLERGLEYDAQEYLRDQNGQIIISADTSHRMQPDIILHLDETRDLIIDSKVSLSAFIDYTNATDPTTQQVALAAHLKSVRQHVKELSKKNYAAYVQSPRQSVDFVMMFVPVDAALQLALNSDVTLWRDAMNQGVFIVGEQNLYAALRAVQVTWTTIKQNANNKAICDTAEELMGRVGDLLERVQKMGKKLTELNTAYDDVLNKATKGQSVLGSAKKLVKLGAKASTVHPLPQYDEDDAIPLTTTPPALEE